MTPFCNVIFIVQFHTLATICAVTSTTFFEELRAAGVSLATPYIVPRGSTGSAQAAHKPTHLERGFGTAMKAVVATF
jgi:hypothetical protein